MKKTALIRTAILFVSLLSLSSCSNDDGPSYGTTTGDYLPLAVNNSWKYFNESQGFLSEVKITGTESIGGNTYYEFTDSTMQPFTVTQWFGKKGATYFMKVDDTTINESGITITFKSYELPILKDDFDVNKTWTGSVSPKVTYSGNGTSGTLPFKINYTGVNYFKGEITLDGTTYPNVIKTKLDVSINANNQITTASEEYWYAENIGIINFISDDGTTIEERTIDSYILN